VHATLAGVVLGLLTPISEIEWLEHRLHPWSSFAIVPLFALANAGVVVSGAALRSAAGSAVSVGVIVGLVVGKLVGISGATWAARRVRLGVLPDDVSTRGLIGVASMGGIGFTVSIFVAGLAFSSAALVNEAKIGILVGSLLSGVVGSAVLYGGDRR
jgi:NhaA family Na+:H+ antiporter